MPRIFLSHASRDNAVAGDFARWLRDNGFEELFLDFDQYDGIPPGDDWERRLYEEIDRATAVVLLLSPQWLDSKWCFTEFTHSRALGKAVLPVVILPGGEKFREKNLQLVDLLKDPSGGYARLLQRLHELALEGPASFTLPAGRAPYPGLLSFERDDAAVFHGREAEVRQTVELLERLRVRGGARIALVHGESGSGKSSLLKAGLLPQLGLRAEDWLLLPPFRPGSHPRGELRSVLLSALEGKHAAEIDALLDTPSPTPEAAEKLLNALRQHHKRYRATILLAIDQFEELLSLPAEEEQAQFLAILTALLDPRGKALAVATLRTSDLPQVAARLEDPQIPREEYLLGPFPLKSLPKIIQHPAKVAGLIVDPELVDAIQRDASSSDTLPLVAFLLRRLYDQHGSDHRLSLAEYESMGDATKGLRPLETCIRDAADEALKRSQPSEPELDALREAFVTGLVRLSDANSYVRRTLPATEIPPQATRLCDALEKERLLIRREDGSLEVAHESLFRVWPLLAGWLEEEQDFMRGLGRIDAALSDWQAQPEGKRQEALLTGLMLRQSEAWLKQHPQRLTGERRRLVEDSIRDRHERAAHKRRALQLLNFLAVFVAVVITALGIQAYRKSLAADREAKEAKKQEGEARKQQALATSATTAAEQSAYHVAVTAAALKIAQGLTQDAGELLDATAAECRQWEWYHLRAKCDNSSLIYDKEDEGETDVVKPAEASGLGWHVDGRRLTSLHRRRTVTSIDTWDSVTGTTLASFEVPLQGDEDFIQDADYSPARNRVVTQSAGSDRLKVWDLVTGRLLHDRAARGSAHWVRFSEGGRLILTRQEEMVQVWEAASGNHLMDLKLGCEVHSVVSSADGRLLAATGPDGEVGVWNLAGEGEPWHHKKPGFQVSACRFSADGSKLAVTFTPVYSADDLGEMLESQEAGEMKAEETVIYSTTAREPLMSLAGGADDLDFSPDGLTLVTSGKSNGVQLWNLQDGKALLHRPAPPFWRHAGQCRFSPDGSMLMIYGHNANIEVLDGKTLEQIAVLTSPARGRSMQLHFSPDGKRVLASIENQGPAVIWDLELAATHRTATVEEGYGKLPQPGRARWSSFRSWSGDRVGWPALQDRRGVRNSFAGEITSSRTGSSFAVSEDGRLAVIIMGEDQDNLCLLRHETADRGPEWATQCPAGVTQLEISPDGSVFAAGLESGIIYLGKTADGRPRPPLAELNFMANTSAPTWPPAVTGLTFSGDGKRIAACRDIGGLAVWDVETGALLASWETDTGFVAAIAMDYRGDRVACLRMSSETEVLEVASQDRRTLDAGLDEIWALNLAPNGQRMAITYSNGDTAIWDPGVGRELLRLSEPGSLIQNLAFSRDGRDLIAGSSDGVIRIWRSMSARERMKEQQRASK